MSKEILIVMAIALAAPAWSAETPASQPASYSASPTPEQVVEQFRTDLQGAARRRHGEGNDADG
jgi:hypothetical protein